MAKNIRNKLSFLGKKTGNKPAMSTFTGDWFTTFGPMTLTQDGSKVHGVYGMGSTECTVEGTIRGGVLKFRYREPNVGGEGWFALERHGKFNGSWRQDGIDKWLPCKGERGFEGAWNTSFGPLRLIQGALTASEVFMKG